MPLLKANDESVRQAAAVLARGGLVAFPTETVYGLGADAYNPAALAKIFEVKKRPCFDPLIVHIAALETLEKIADFSLLNTTARKRLFELAENLWPGPLTIILPKQKTIPDLATSGLPTVAVRLPENKTARQLISLSSGAVAAPSANPFGFLSPTRAEHVQDMLGEKIEIILDGGPSQVGVESTVLDISGDQPRILRPGGVPKETIETFIGATAFDLTAASGITAPGQLKSHYAPRTPFSVYDKVSDMPNESDSALLFFDGASRDEWLSERNTTPLAAITAVLSETGNLLEAAANLFQTLHDLDKKGVRRIHGQFAPEGGLGVAINDRLRRAAYIDVISPKYFPRLKPELPFPIFSAKDCCPDTSADERDQNGKSVLPPPSKTQG